MQAAELAAGGSAAADYVYVGADGVHPKVRRPEAPAA